MNNRKHIESSGPFAGLWIRTARALREAGYKSREKVRDDIRSGALSPGSILDYGRFADAEVRAWLSLNDTDALGLWRSAAKNGTPSTGEDKRGENSPGNNRRPTSNKERWMSLKGASDPRTTVTMKLEALKRRLSSQEKHCTELWAEMGAQEQEYVECKQAGALSVQAFKKYDRLRIRYLAEERWRVLLRGSIAELCGEI